MTYQDTARRFIRASESTRSGAAPDAATLGADKLPLSEWAESRRHLMTPQTVAQNHALHVQGVAADLRDALSDEARGDKFPSEYVADVEDAARALLTAIGEADA